MHNSPFSHDMRYALITPARNEGELIEKVIQSMIAQTVLPSKWVIVDDGSNLIGPLEIVESYAQRYPWMGTGWSFSAQGPKFCGKGPCI